MVEQYSAQRSSIFCPHVSCTLFQLMLHEIELVSETAVCIVHTNYSVEDKFHTALSIVCKLL